MSTIYKGTTKKYLVKIQDKQGNTIDPESISRVDVIIRHEVTHTEYAKFSTSVVTGYTHVNTVDGKVVVPVDAVMTAAMEVGEIRVITLCYFNDADFVTGKAVIPNQGILATVKEL